MVLVSPTLAGLGADVSSDKPALAYSAPAYDIAPKATDAQMGVNSLAFMRPDLARQMLKGRGRPAYGMMPLPDLPSSSQVPVNVVVSPPPPPPVPVLVGPPGSGSGAGGGSPGSGGPGGPGGGGGTGGGGGVISSDPGYRAGSDALLSQGYGANAYAYGGQSIVNIAVQSGEPAHDVEGYAYPGGSSASGTSGDDGGSGLLPDDDGSLLRFAAGFALGWLAVSWASGRRS